MSGLFVQCTVPIEPPLTLSAQRDRRIEGRRGKPERDSTLPLPRRVPSLQRGMDGRETKFRNAVARGLLRVSEWSISNH